MSAEQDGHSEGSTISVVLNGDERSVPEGLTVAGLLEHLELHPGMVVVELNREILPKDTYTQRSVSSGDRIELVHFVGGG